MEKVKILGISRDYNSLRVHTWATHEPNQRARFAMELIRHNGVVAAKVDGEDSAGRSKAAPLTPSEIVEKACQIADALFDQLHARGWMDEVPQPTEEMIKHVLKN